MKGGLNNYLTKGERIKDEECVYDCERAVGRCSRKAVCRKKLAYAMECMPQSRCSRTVNGVNGVCLIKWTKTENMGKRMCRLVHQVITV